NAARVLLRKAGKDVAIVSHDCWAYMVVSGCGGKIFYDTAPTIRYRQHEGNLVGTNLSWRARWSRGTRLWNGWFRSWNDRNIESLQRLYGDLTPENKRILDDFSAARQTWLLPRLYLLARCGVRRQSMAGNLALFVAATFNKI
ncbi:MAG: glycosyltransferase family 2 protein, partial [Janthinobacterium sp.]